jgi:trans-aconitate 2-methyltransferase
MTGKTKNSDWNPDRYLRFRDERTQPSIDLVRRIDLAAPERIIDLGCGPGNSTAVLKNRWPKALITGLDQSEAMLQKARNLYPEMEFIRRDLTLDLTPLGSFDLIFSNAALQWVKDSHLVLPRLFDRLNPGGALAVQAPCPLELPSQLALQKLLDSPKWQKYLGPAAPRPEYHDYRYFYRALEGQTKDMQLWRTDYIPIMPGLEAIGQWYEGSSLRPFFDALPEPGLKSEFEAEYQAALRPLYPLEKDGSVLHPFTRIFLVAGKPEGKPA